MPDGLPSMVTCMSHSLVAVFTQYMLAVSPRRAKSYSVIERAVL